VQRLPVRIRLDPQQLAKHALRVGLSMNVTVDLTSRAPDKSPREG
jgi:membrane fusion protein (multidrug efflux system)